MNLVKQLPGSNFCVQACVAMVLGVRLEVAIGMVGKWGKTNTRDLKRALLMGGMAVDLNKKSVMGVPHMGTAICKVHQPDKRLHWVVYHEGEYFDPGGWITEGTPVCGRVTSYFPIGWKTT